MALSELCGCGLLAVGKPADPHQARSEILASKSMPKAVMIVK